LGYGTVAASVIMFIGVISIIIGFVILGHTYIKDTATSLDIQKTRIVNEINSNLAFVSKNYDNNTYNITIYIKNSGNTVLDLNNTDIYLSGERIERNSRTITKENPVTAPPLWSPKEIIKIVFNKELNLDISTIKVVSDNGISTEDLIYKNNSLNLLNDSGSNGNLGENSNPFDQDLNTTSNVEFNNLTINSGTIFPNYAVCYLSDGTLGHCESAIASDGTCSCITN